MCWSSSTYAPVVLGEIAKTCDWMMPASFIVRLLLDLICSVELPSVLRDRNSRALTGVAE